jgi:signal transduction histidine kinase
LRKDGSVVVAETVGHALDFEGEPSILVIGRDLTERRQLAAKMMQMDRMIATGTLAAGVGHEINNPLAYVIGNLDFIAEELPEILAQAGPPIQAASPAPSGDLALRVAELRQVIDEAREGAGRVRDVVRNLMTLSNAETNRLKPVDLRRVAEAAVSLTWNEIRHRARLVKDYGPVPPVIANEARLGQVLLNLLLNAAHAIPEGRAKTNEIRIRTFADGGRACVEVQDTGSGISSANLPRVFDPFFTTKPVGQGMGLGLSICRGIIHALGGELDVQSEPGKGATFRVALPAAAEGSELAVVPAPAPLASGRRGLLLVVDDDPRVGSALRRVLVPEHDAIVVGSGREALERLGAGERFDLIFCDLMMPEMTGMDLHAEILRSYPDHAARMVFFTGGAFTPQASRFLEELPNPRLEKPFDAKTVRALVRELLD